MGFSPCCSWAPMRISAWAEAHPTCLLISAIDPNHPTIYRDIMVGTRLVIVVSSDAGGYWLGRLQLSQDDEEYATLSGRGYISTRPGRTAFYPNYKGPCLDSAGGEARVRSFTNPADGIGFDLNTTVTGASTGAHPAVPGDWFIIDYRAEQIGTCASSCITWPSVTPCPSRRFPLHTSRPGISAVIRSLTSRTSPSWPRIGIQRSIPIRTILIRHSTPTGIPRLILAIWLSLASPGSSEPIAVCLAAIPTTCRRISDVVPPLRACGHVVIVPFAGDRAVPIRIPDAGGLLAAHH
jgi:hypothetical protein